MADKEGVYYDGDQSEKLAKITGNSAGNGGINFNNTQLIDGDDNKWEKQQGVNMAYTGKFKDVQSKDAYEVDLKPHIKVIGMPNPNINHNSSDDCYGG